MSLSSVSQCGGKNIRITVMQNVLPSELKYHEKYDLKGSTYKRRASKRERCVDRSVFDSLPPTFDFLHVLLYLFCSSKATPTLKDLDFNEKNPEGILLETEMYNALCKTIERDCRVITEPKNELMHQIVRNDQNMHEHAFDFCFRFYKASKSWITAY